MSNQRIDMNGQRSGRLIVLGVDEEASKIHRETMWICRCDCGNITLVSGSSLRRGHALSCGCLKRELEIRSRKNPEIYLNDEKGFGIAFLVRDNDKNDFVAFDIEDIDIIKNGAWSKSKDGYIRAFERGSGTKSKSILLHRAIMSKYENIDDKVIDHINHNKSDERKDNMRSCTIQENNINRHSPIHNNPDHHMHICYNKPNNSWQVEFKINGENIVRQFKTKDEAIEYEKEYASNNPLFIEFGYKDEQDIRNNKDFKGFFIGGENNKYHPFYIVDNTSMAPPNPEDVVSPFSIIDEEKFNNK